MMKKWMLMGWLMLPAVATAGLNDSGQAQCYDGADLTPCTAETAGDATDYPRQDGRFGRDTRPPGLDIQPLDEQGGMTAQAPPACHSDRRTGLTWELLATGTPRAALPWDQVAALAASLNERAYCGLRTWRLPSHQELQSIVDYGRLAPAIDPKHFTDATHESYWTADLLVGKPDAVWTIQFIDGGSRPTPKASAQRVRLVASAPQTGRAPLTVQADGGVYDKDTGLIWDRCSIGQLGEDCSQGAAQRLTWSDALRASVEANTRRHKGHQDWRLPNVKELLSLADLARPCPTIDAAAFPKTVCDWYWSSTPRAGEPGRAWDVGFDDGHIGHGIEDLKGYVRLVRDPGEIDILKHATADTAKPEKN
ncbi:MAG: DUF1566 domain-containing protein [Uliginosibacterium sp.]|nr:DUF1566 domain-containing protein [Uliginosibacterium sp.]